MPLDSICLTAIADELRADLIGKKVDKIQQPEKDMLIFTMRGIGGTSRMLVSSGTGSARVHLTERTFENPQSPPMFCMLLRKYLLGGKILSIYQKEAERMLDIEFDTLDAMGVSGIKHLIIELMGRSSNVILTSEDGTIIDCMRRISGEMSDSRRVLPGLFYREPDDQGKIPFTLLTDRDLREKLSDADEDMKLDKWMLDSFGGASPLVMREICNTAYGAPSLRVFEAKAEDSGEKLFRAAMEVRSRAENGNFEPCILTDENDKPKDFSFMPIYQYGTSLKLNKENSFSELLDSFYAKRDKLEQMHRKTQSVMKLVKNLRDRTTRRLAAQMDELRQTENRELYRQYGDIITSNLYKMKKGMTLLQAENFYEPDMPVCNIKLDPLKTPQQNAARYYRDYNKAKTAEQHLTELTSKGEVELDYLNSIIEALEKVETERDVQEIKQELLSAGYIKQPKQKGKTKPIEQKPMRFISSTGREILVGKNNLQNDRLTFKIAYRYDIWLHAQKIHGSHVVISAKGEEVDDKTLGEAASLAAYFSQSGEGAKVAVDYTLVKNVKKPGGAKPGMVIYTDYKTVIASPDEKLAESLRVKLK